MIVTSSDDVPGQEKQEVLGLVRGNTVRARNVGRDITQSIRNLAGGELKAYSTLLTDSRDEAIERMEREAEELDADAVVTLRLTTGQVTGNSVEILAYGTAVRLESES